MKNFIKNKEGAVVPYILVLAAIILVLSFFAPRLKGETKDATKGTEEGIDYVLSDTSFSSKIPSDSGTSVIPENNNPSYRSCKELLQKQPTTTSGEYEITTATGRHKVYCDMTTDGGGWTRLANYDYATNTTSPSVNLFAKNGMTSETYDGAAPNGWYSQFDGNSYSRDVSVRKNIEGFPYQEVRAELSVSMMWTVDGFSNSHGGNANYMNATIEEQYVDGVSITYGEKGTRKHLWTISTNGLSTTDSRYAFVKNDYYTSVNGTTFSKTLSKKLSGESKEPIEMRLMTDQRWYDENIGLHKYILWVR